MRIDNSRQPRVPAISIARNCAHWPGRTTEMTTGAYREQSRSWIPTPPNLLIGLNLEHWSCPARSDERWQRRSRDHVGY